ncbi:helix-turn-helix domain-containing protein [Streptomyces sp. NPDC059015]|uniref:helix-turn-helix domain-containing protein n=1 Tax=unclassified Streptomyces TaxID=2593676 RepID=UPI0036A4498C
MEEPPATTYLVNGAAIRTRRKDLGIDLAECAAAAGISRPYLDQLELGHRRRMKPPTYHRLRTALRIEPSDRQLLAPPEEQQRKE